MKDCGLKYRSRGYCEKHYWRFLKHGDPNTVLYKTFPKSSDANEYLNRRFKVKSNDCWLWVGTISHNGYGKSNFQGVRQSAHRLAYEQWVGVIDEHAEIHHACANRLCVNPDHLQMVSGTENRAEMRERKAYKKEIASLRKEVKALKRKVKKT